MSCLEQSGFRATKLARVLAWLVCAAMWCGAMWLPRTAWAQDTSTQSSGQSSGQLSEHGNWDIGVWTSGAAGYEGAGSFWDGRIWSAGASVFHPMTGEIGPRWFRGDLAYGFILTPAFVAAKPQSIHGGGFEPVVVRYTLDRPGRISPYFESGGGGIFTTSNFPAGKTSAFNFTVHTGAGLQIATRRGQAVDIGLSYRHYSNANLGTENPSFNGLEIVIGYHWLR